MGDNQLVEIREFVSLKARSTRGDDFHPCGENLYGLLNDENGGRMLVLLMRSVRPHFRSAEPYMPVSGGD